MGRGSGPDLDRLVISRTHDDGDATYSRKAQQAHLRGVEQRLRAQRRADGTWVAEGERALDQVVKRQSTGARAFGEVAYCATDPVDAQIPGRRG